MIYYCVLRTVYVYDRVYARSANIRILVLFAFSIRCGSRDYPMRLHELRQIPKEEGKIRLYRNFGCPIHLDQWNLRNIVSGFLIKVLFFKTSCPVVDKATISLLKSPIKMAKQILCNILPIIKDS